MQRNSESIQMTVDEEGGEMHETRVHLGTRLSLKRTRLAYDRTLMAWVRTSVSLITFGFSIYKFFELGDFKISTDLIGPRIYASVMIVVGLGALVLAVLDHRSSLNELISEGAEFRIPPRARWVAGAVAILGLLAMAAVVFRA